MKSTTKYSALMALVLGLASTQHAMAHDNIRFGISIGSPGYYAPPVRYYAPPPVVYYDAPATVYYGQPQVVYREAPRYYGGERCRDGWRNDGWGRRDWDNRRDWDGRRGWDNHGWR